MSLVNCFVRPMPARVPKEPVPLLNTYKMMVWLATIIGVITHCSRLASLRWTVARQLCTGQPLRLHVMQEAKKMMYYSLKHLLAGRQAGAVLKHTLSSKLSLTSELFYCFTFIMCLLSVILYKQTIDKQLASCWPAQGLGAAVNMCMTGCDVVSIECAAALSCTQAPLSILHSCSA